MSSPPATDGTATAFAVLSDPRRRYLLSTLRDRSGPLALERLATEVTVAERGAQIVTDEQVRPVHVELVHNHVPRLLDLGLVTEASDSDPGTDDSRRRLALADHPILEAEWVSRLLAAPTGGPACDEALLNRTLEVLGPTRRRAICLVLARRDDATTVGDLAALVADVDDDSGLLEGDESRVRTRLVHDDLPALADAGLLEYDREGGSVALETDTPRWRTEFITRILRETGNRMTGDEDDAVLVGRGFLG